MSDSSPAPHTQRNLLLTDTDKQDVVDSVLQHIPNSGGVFLPPENFYEKTESFESLKRIHTSLCVWLGIKPKSIPVTFNSELQSSGRYLNVNGKPTISVHSNHAQNPFQLAAIVAHCLSHYAVDSTVGIGSILEAQQEEIIDRVSIQSGLGVVILNGYCYSTSPFTILHRIRRQLFSSQANQVQLGYFSVDEFSKRFVASSNAHHILPLNYIRQLLPGSRKLVKRYVGLPVTPYTQSPKSIQHIHTRIVRNRIKIICLTIVTISLLALSLLAWNSHHKDLLTPEQLTLKNKAELLHKTYDICSADVAAKRAVMDTSDLFVQQSIDAKASHCESLRNQYNATVDEYTQSIQK